MNILVIPDVHGRPFWKDAVEKHSEDCEKIVFLGDYLDPYPWEWITRKMTIENFKEIIKYKKDNQEKVVLLLGNHDRLAVAPLDVFVGALNDINYPIITFEGAICLCPVIILVAISCVIARDIVAIGAGTAIVTTGGQAESESKRQADRQDLRESSEFATHWDSLPPTGASFSVT